MRPFVLENEKTMFYTTHTDLDQMEALYALPGAFNIFGSTRDS